MVQCHSDWAEVLQFKYNDNDSVWDDAEQES